MRRNVHVLVMAELSRSSVDMDSSTGEYSVCVGRVVSLSLAG